MKEKNNLKYGKSRVLLYDSEIMRTHNLLIDKIFNAKINFSRKALKNSNISFSVLTQCWENF